MRKRKKRLVEGIFSIVFIVIVFPLSLFAQITFERTYGGPGWEFCYSVQQTTDNGYILTGATGSPYFDFNVYLVKTDSFGDTLWTKAYGDSLWEFGYSVQQTSDGGYILAGFTNSFGAGSTDIYLIKTDSHGDTLWTRIYGGLDTDRGWSVQQTKDDGYIIVGSSYSFGNELQAYLIKTDTLGNVSVEEERAEERREKREERFLSAHPNPFSTTTISFALPSAQGHKSTGAQDIELNIYDVSGRLVRSFRSSVLTLRSSVTWDGRDDGGISVKAGIYFIRVNILSGKGRERLNKKLIKIK